MSFMNRTLESLLWSSRPDSLRKGLMEWIQGALARLDPARQEGKVLARAKKYIQAHLQHPVNLTEVSQETLVTPQYLSKLFREKSGETFIEYITRLRIEEAKRLLAEPGVKVYEVASQVGYSNWSILAACLSSIRATARPITKIAFSSTESGISTSCERGENKRGLSD